MIVRRITSGDEWKYRNGLAGLRGRDMASLYVRAHSIASGAILLTPPWAAIQSHVNADRGRSRMANRCTAAVITQKFRIKVKRYQLL